MSRHERYGTRDLSFSKWHRDIPDDDLTMIDLDCIEYCENCKRTLALIELAQDVGQEYKNAEVTRRLALRLGIPAYLVFYQIEPTPIFRIQLITKPPSLEIIYNEGEMVAFLKKIHNDCPCQAHKNVLIS